MRRRRRFFRDDVLAPWLTLIVIGVIWWTGARAFGSKASTSVTRGALPSAVAAKASSEAAPLEESPPPSRARDAVLARAPEDGGDLEVLRGRHLLIPVEGVLPERIHSDFNDPRGGGRKHEALDILAPRGTPVLAADDGRVAKLFHSAAGGITLYQFDPAEHFSYYYAHLDRYASGISERDFLKRGEILGYVGTTGNAPPGTPHLHFAIYRLGPEKRWWEGEPLDPAIVLKQ